MALDIDRYVEVVYGLRYRTMTNAPRYYYVTLVHLLRGGRERVISCKMGRSVPERRFEIYSSRSCHNEAFDSVV